MPMKTVRLKTKKTGHNVKNQCSSVIINVCSKPLNCTLNVLYFKQRMQQDHSQAIRNLRFHFYISLRFLKINLDTLMLTDGLSLLAYFKSLHKRENGKT